LFTQTALDEMVRLKKRQVLFHPQLSHLGLQQFVFPLAFNMELVDNSEDNAFLLL